MNNDLVVIIPFYEGHDHLDPLLDSLARFSQVKKVVIVDDQSDKPLGNGFSHRDGMQILVARPKTKGYFTGAVNHGMELCLRPDNTYPDFLILNQDTYFTNSDAFRVLIPEYAHRYDVFGERNVGSSITFPHGYIHGTFMYISGRAVETIGFLDAKNFPLWGSTADYQVRAIRAGLPTNALKEIPGFIHKRSPDNQFGSSIEQFMSSHQLKPGSTEFQRLVQIPPLVSVIVPCYNYGKYLPDTMASLLGGPSQRGLQPGQTFKSFEIIIVDDCSTDDSWDIAQSYIDEAKLIRAYQTDRNSGTSITVDYGIQHSTGRYVTFLSADDMRAPDALQELYDACVEYPHHFAYDDIVVWDTDREREDIPWLMPPEADLKVIRNRNNIHAGIMYSRYDYETVGGYAPIMGRGREDWGINIAFLSNGICGVHVPSLGYIYRRHGENRTLSNSWVPQRIKNLANLKKLYPAAYDDERLKKMPCCGGSRTVQTTRTATRTTRTLRKEPAMSKDLGTPVNLTYTGQAMSKTYTGQVTNQRYRFGKDRPKGYVYPDDVQPFLEYREQGIEVFEPTTTEEEVAVATSKVIPNSNEVVKPEADPATREAEIPKANVDISTLSIPQVREMRATRSQWELMLAEEKANRDRTGVVKFITAKLNPKDA